MLVRPYQDQDREQVIDLWRACKLIRHQHNDPIKAIALKVSFQPELFLVGILEDKVVATVMAGFEGRRGWINYLGVSPDMQRLGLGKRIMQEAQIRLEKMGCPKINLQVRTSNKQVIDFYKSLGYMEDDVISLGKLL